ncbi:MAG: DUF6677 family protein [Planctomycetota bacterium JB042]
MATSNVKIAVGLLLAWLVPGLGHLRYGRRGKALLFFVLLSLAFVLGLWLGEWRDVHAEKFPLYLLAQIWLGGPTLLALATTADLRITNDIAQLDAGLLFTSVAGLLNVVVMVDLYEVHLKIRQEAGTAAEATS